MASLDSFPVDWAYPVAVVAMPDEIDIANAQDVRDTLLAVLNQGATTVIVDLTQTTFCACAGAGAFACAHQRARAGGGQVRLVARAPIVRRLLAVTGIEDLMPVFDSLSAARPAGRRRAWREDGSDQGWSASNGGGAGLAPATPVTISSASTRSLTLRFCEALRRAANALSWEQCSWPMRTPTAWSMTAREASDSRSWSVSAA